MEPTRQDQLCLQDAKEFANPVLNRLKPMARGIMRNLFLGVLASGSTLLTQIGRALWPRKPIRTAINLLSRYLINSRVPMKKVRAEHLKQQAAKVRQNAWVYIDPSDVAKPYARILEHLAFVRDASLDRIVMGYWTLHAIALNAAAEAVGLMTEIFSVENPQTPSFPGFVQACVEALHEALGACGIFVMDQGMDSDEMIGLLSRKERRFVLRVRQTRRVMDANGHDLGLLEDLGPSVPYEHRIWTWDAQEKKRRAWDLFGCSVRLEAVPGAIFGLVCVRWRHGGQLHYFYLLTNLPITAAWRIDQVLKGYLGRQLVEDYIRFVKQQVQMEKFLVQKFERISRLVWVVGWVANFLVEQNRMGVRRLRYFVRELKALVKEWKERWTLAAGGFALALCRSFRRRAPNLILPLAEPNA
jgi:hypothetical protein